MTRFAWPIMFCVAAVVAMRITELRSADRALARKTCLFAIAGGILGARGWFSAQYGLGASGMSSYGFAMGAVLVAVLYRRLRLGRWDIGDLADAAAPAILMGAALVRVGCFIHGCCYGKPSDLPWAVSYGPSTPAYASQLKLGVISGAAASSLPVHPTQLYEGFFVAALCGAVLAKGRSLPLPRYCVFLLSVALYATFRFFVEFIRGDAGGFRFGPLTFAQTTSLAVLVAAVWLMAWRFSAERRVRAREATA